MEKSIHLLIKKKKPQKFRKMSQGFKNMNLDGEETEQGYHHRPRPKGWWAEAKYDDLEATVDGIGQSMAQLLKVIGQ